MASQRNDQGWTKQQRLIVEEAVRRKRQKEDARRRLTRSSSSLIGTLHPKQREFFESSGRKRLARCSRRAGKTYLAAVGLIDAAVSRDRLLVPYITLSIKNARRIVWNTLQEIERDWGLGMEFLENQLTVRFPNASQIIMGGCQDSAEIEKFRGPRYSLCVIDECQSIKTSILERLVGDILEPASLDLDGRIWMFGTPAAGSAGYFYDADQMMMSSWERHHWTLLDNPHLPGAEQWLERTREENNWDVEDATYRREYLGEWVRDDDSLVYNFSRGRNLVEVLPDGEWQYCLGVDLGFVDATAFVVVAWSRVHPETFVIAAEKHTGMVSEDIARRVTILDGEYGGFLRVVADTGGLGKMVVEEISRRHAIKIYPAQKREKHAHIKLLNSDLKKGKLLFLEGTGTRELVDEMELLEWDNVERYKGRFIERQDQDNHATDALLYVWRESLAFLHEEQQVFEVGTPEWEDAEEWSRQAALEASLDGETQQWGTNDGIDPIYTVN